MTSTDDLKRKAAEDGIEFFFAMFVDMHGKPCAKLIPVAYLDDMMSIGAGFAGFAAGPMGQQPSDPDILALPDAASYTPVPWQPGLAILQCDPHVEGQPWPYAPRLILKRQLDRLAERGFVCNVGMELEHFLVRRTDDGRIVPADPLDTADKPCYDAKGLTRMYGHLTRTSRYMNELGWGNYANDHEDANGQFEQNIRYADALTTADRAIVFRYMIHTLAHEAGLTATFMAKPFEHLTGSGMHTHCSLWNDDGSTAFEDADDARGLGLSELAYHFIGGVLEHAAALTAIAAPTVNSYKRIGVGAPASGATWAPGYATYGGNNRTVLLRVPDPGRFEHRGVDGSANPYLALAGIVAAGLDGIDRKLDPGPPQEGNFHTMPVAEVRGRGIQPLPRTLLEATDLLASDGVLRDALGTVPGGDYVDYYVDVKHQEFFDYHGAVSAWEVDRYLTLF